jgi:glycosyltransferase involved in cell wall biosynthesis
LSKALLIANTLPPRDVSGVGEQVLQLAAGLRDLGWQVEVPGRWGPKILFPLTSVPLTLAALLRFRPQVVQVHESDGALAALAIRLLRPFLPLLGIPKPRLLALLQVSYRRERQAVRPLVDRRSGSVLGEPGTVERRFRHFKAPLHIALGWLTARLADGVLAPSRVTAGEIEADYGVRGVEVLPNITGGLPTPVEDLPMAAEGFEDALLFVGRLRIRKGVEVMLEALARRDSSDARLLVAGDGEHGPALRQRVRELGLEERVRFLGHAPAGQVRALLRTARCLVVPSTYEGMPLVILEAMEAGLPIVATTVSGIPEVVVDGETGWLVPSEDPEALAEALVRVLGDPDDARRRGEAGRARLEAHYRPRHGAEVWVGLVGVLSPSVPLSQE